MIHRKRADAEWLEFELLQPYAEVVHGVFLRRGGMECLGLSEWAACRHVHGKDVALVTDGKLSMEDCDGMITKDRDRGLVIKHADCQAAIFYDPVQKVIANVHSGWRGSVLNIYAETVRRLVDGYGCRREDLLVCISPSLGPDDAEFVNYKAELPESFWEFQSIPNHFDFWAISTKQLAERGVKPDHIEIAGLSNA